MGRLLALTVGMLLWSLTGQAQVRTNISNGETLPARCRSGDVFMKRGASAGLYACDAFGSWQTVGSGGGGTGTVHGSGVADQIAGWSDTDTIGGLGVNFQYGSPSIGPGDGSFSLSIGPPLLARSGLSSAVPLVLMNQDDDSGHTDVYVLSFVDSITKYAYAEQDFGLVNPNVVGGAVKTLFINGAEGVMNDAGDVSSQNYYIYDAIAGSNLLKIEPTISTFFTRVVLNNGLSIDTTTTTAHTALLRAYDVDGTAYKTFLTLTNGNTPDMTIMAPSGGTITLQPTTYKSSDGTSGVTVTTCTGFKNGLCISGT